LDRIAIISFLIVLDNKLKLAYIILFLVLVLVFYSYKYNIELWGCDLVQTKKTFILKVFISFFLLKSFYCYNKEWLGKKFGRTQYGFWSNCHNYFFPSIREDPAWFEMRQLSNANNFLIRVSVWISGWKHGLSSKPEWVQIKDPTWAWLTSFIRQ